MYDFSQNIKQTIIYFKKGKLTQNTGIIGIFLSKMIITRKKIYEIREN